MFCIYPTPTSLVSFYVFVSQLILLAFVLVLEQTFPVCTGHHSAWITSDIEPLPSILGSNDRAKWGQS